MLRAVIVLFLLAAVTPSTWGQLSYDQFRSLMKTVRWLEGNDIAYREKVKLPGESEPRMMDCSNTVRYIYQEALGIPLPRVASGQYWELSRAGKITAAPTTIQGHVDTPRLLREMASGDLLFWEWTYNIKRTPPITHVMIYLGRDKNGIPRMAGSSSSRKNGGVGIYRFDPNASMGGVRNASGKYIKRARFVGYGRPLEYAEHSSRVANR
ncbi:MAG: NlpC/P60 family protein [Verrucomicrobiota bacterium]